MTGLVSEIGPVSVSRVKRFGAVLAVVVIAAVIFALVVFALAKVWPRADQTPAIVGRKDEKTAQHVAAGIGAAAEAGNRDATVHIDLNAKEIYDAFSTLQPPQPVVAGTPRALPAAPVDRLRDRLNQSIARANRAAGAAAASE